MTSTIPVPLGQRLQRGLLAALFWTPVLAPIMHLLNNSLMVWLGFRQDSLLYATAMAATILFTMHSTSAAQLSAEAGNRVDRIIHDPTLGLTAKLSAITRDRLGGALTLYLPLFIAAVATSRV